MKRKCDVTGIEARLLDVCLSDYFQGSSAPEVLAIPVYSEMTRKEFYEALKHEFHASDGYFDMADAGNMGELAFHSLVSALHAGGWEENGQSPFRFATSIDEEPTGENVYAYVGLFAEYE